MLRLTIIYERFMTSLEVSLSFKIVCMKRSVFCLFVVVLAFISCDAEPVKLQGQVFGTTYSIIYYGSSNYDKDFQELFDAVNQSLSTYIPDSDISRINKGEASVQVDAYFKEVFEKSGRIYKETDGYFDPTVGRLVNAWGFGPEKALNTLTQQTVDSLMNFVGFAKVSLQGNTLVKQHPEIYFDFNAVAKGYGIDVIARFLEQKGVQNYLVEIGGEVRCKGVKPNGKKWAVMLDSPNTDGSRTAYDVIELSNSAMASSGNYRKFRVSKTGEKFVHTINPKTGYAKESNLLSASVIANMDCADVDAYATAFMAMGFEKTKEFLTHKPELKVILIYVNDQGAIDEFRN